MPADEFKAPDDETPDETPDGRPGVALLIFSMSGKELAKQVERRVGGLVQLQTRVAQHNVDRPFGAAVDVGELGGVRRQFHHQRVDLEEGPVLAGPGLAGERAGAQPDGRDGLKRATARAPHRAAERL